jgi:hypothetical protein
MFNPLNAELNPICHLLALLGAHHILYVGRIRVKCCAGECVLQMPTAASPVMSGRTCKSSPRLRDLHNALHISGQPTDLKIIQLIHIVTVNTNLYNESSKLASRVCKSWSWKLCCEWRRGITEMYALPLRVKPDISVSTWNCIQMFRNLYLIEIQNSIFQIPSEFWWNKKIKIDFYIVCWSVEM